MIKSFRTTADRALFEGDKCHRKWRAIERQARRKLLMVSAAAELMDLTRPPGNRLEPLKGDRLGQHSIRINDQYRVCFTWNEGNAYNVEIVDYH